MVTHVFFLVVSEHPAFALQGSRSKLQHRSMSLQNQKLSFEILTLLSNDLKDFMIISYL